MASCVACARPLRADAAGHGAYQLRGTECIVSACSRGCASIGTIVALIGAPPTKRSAGDAELETFDAKAAALEDDAIYRAADRKRLQMWLRMIDDAIFVFSDPSEPGPTTATLRNVVANIGAPMPNGRAGAIAEMQRLRDALQRVLDKIDGNEPYNMDDITLAARNSLARLAAIESQDYLTTQRALESDSYLRSIPRELQTAVAHYATGGRRKPDATFSWQRTVRSSSAGVLRYVGKYIYVQTMDYGPTLDVLSFGGQQPVGTITIPSNITLNWTFEPAMPAAGGELCTVYPSIYQGFGLFPGSSEKFRMYSIPEVLIRDFAIDAETERIMTLSHTDGGRTAQLEIYQILRDGIGLIERHHIPMEFLLAGKGANDWKIPKLLQFIDHQALFKVVAGESTADIYTIVDLSSGIVERVAIRSRTRILSITLIARTHVLCSYQTFDRVLSGVMLIPRTLLNGIVTPIPNTGPPPRDGTIPKFGDDENFFAEPESRAPFILYEYSSGVRDFQTFVHRDRFHCAYVVTLPVNTPGKHIIDTFLLDNSP